jgi:uncharacterized protein (DUF488 family)
MFGGWPRCRPSATVACVATALFTIGYQGRALDELIAMLEARRISRVIDVRDLPLSRRRGFSKTPLREALAAAGIEYVHLREAGNPYRRERHTLEVRELLAKYGGHLDGARDAVLGVAAAVRGKRVALLCYELDHATCHRSILAPRVARKLGVPLTNL